MRIDFSCNYICPHCNPKLESYLQENKERTGDKNEQWKLLLRERKGKPKPPYIKFGNTNTSLQVRFGAMSQTIHIVAGNITG